MAGQYLDNHFDLINGLNKYKQARQVFRAVAATTIEPGYPVRMVYTTLGAIAAVTPANSTNHGDIEGIYVGDGGTGAVTTTTGLSGRATAAGDIIEVVSRGFCNVRGRMTATNANTLSTTNVGQILGAATVDYTFNIVAMTAGQTPKVVLSTAGAVTDGTTAEIVGVYVEIQ